MSISSQRAKKMLKEIQKTESIAKLAKKVMQRTKQKLAPADSIPSSEPDSKKGQEARLSFLQKQTGQTLTHVAGGEPFDRHEDLMGNIENYIGMAQVPIGIAGPILINGTQANGDFFIPLATTEGALVASYSRGIKACRMSGGISSVCLIEGIQRSPFFKFVNIIEVGRFVGWILENLEQFSEITGQVSKYAKLDDVKTNIEGNTVILTFEYTTGDAAGQNMITICTNHICQYIFKNAPIKPKLWFIESNYSGDKKATALSFSNVRGKKVTAEIVVSRENVIEVLKTTPEKMVEYWKSSTLAVIQSGSIGAQGHVANCLTALFIACGQDAACISESAVGITRMELTEGNDIYVSVTLPSLIVGTVGGGTGLPTQKECLELMGCYGKGKAKKLAEICGAVALAGEVSIAAAMSAGHFSDAHERLGRKHD